MKKLIAILIACVLLAAMLLVTGCDKTSPGTGDDAGNTGDTNNNSNGDNDNAGGSGNAGNNGDSGDSDDIESPVSDFEFELSDDGSGYTVTKYIGSDERVSIPSEYLDKPVTSIGEGAFYFCLSLTSITIPNSVTSIGHWAFNGCDSLTTINYTGSEEEWNAISKGRLWDGDDSNVYYTINYNYGKE